MSISNVVRRALCRWSKWNTVMLLGLLGVFYMQQYSAINMKPGCISLNQYSASVSLQQLSERPLGVSHFFAFGNHEDKKAGTLSKSIAIGLALKYRTKTPIEGMAFFDLLLNSFCQTASNGFLYHFYIAYDKLDEYFRDADLRSNFTAYFQHVLNVNCSSDVARGTVMHWVESDHEGEPARAQNDALMAAYYGCDCEYYFRVIDDSVIVTPGWTELLIAGLKSMDPPDVGMVGPNITRAPKDLLTVEFVHRNHFNIFGFYYPYVFKHWWADSWLNHVYEPNHKITVQEVKFIHMLSRFNNRARYTVDFMVKNVKYDDESIDTRYFHRYLKARKQGGNDWPPPCNTSHVISMSLYGNKSSNINGAIRNAQMMPVFFPGWTLRMYIPKPSNQFPAQAVPDYILRKLTNLGVKLVEVDPLTAKFFPELYSWLALDDLSADFVLVRNVTSRPSNRDALTVKDWMLSNRIFHSIRDHPAFVNTSIIPGAFGAKPNDILNILPYTVTKLLQNSLNIFKKLQDTSNVEIDHNVLQLHILDKYVWPHVMNATFNHDSVSCDKWPNSTIFPVHRRRIRKIQTPKEVEFIPTVYDEHHRIGYNITYDNEEWWTPFQYTSGTVMRKCQIR